MSLISYTNKQDNVDAANASSLNTPFNTIYDEFNGNIDSNNLADNAVTTNKLIDDAVTAAKVDFGGAGSGIWWEEIKRVTLLSAGDTISATSVTAKKYLKVIILGLNTGQLAPNVRFNNDSGNNYSLRISDNGAADATFPSQSGITPNGAFTCPIYAEMQIVNVATQEKLVMLHSILAGTAGGANTTSRRESFSKWANTSDQITRIDVINNGTGDFAIGSEIIILGHD